MLVTFLNGLGPQYSTIVQSLFIRSNITLEEVKSVIDSHDRYHRYQNEASHVAKDSSQIAARQALSVDSSNEEVTEKLSMKVVERAAQLISRNDRLVKKRKANLNANDYDISDCPHSPTPCEKT